jgi:hypothetical protein
MRLESVEVPASLGLIAVAILVKTRRRGSILVRGTAHTFPLSQGSKLYGDSNKRQPYKRVAPASKVLSTLSNPIAQVNE